MGLDNNMIFLLNLIEIKDYNVHSLSEVTKHDLKKTDFNNAMNYLIGKKIIFNGVFYKITEYGYLLLNSYKKQVQDEASYNQIMKKLQLENAELQNRTGKYEEQMRNLKSENIRLDSNLKKLQITVNKVQRWSILVALVISVVAICISLWKY